MMFDKLEVYPTDVCQLGCSLCQLNRGKHSLGIGVLKKLGYTKLLDRVKQEISILGGEPTKWKYLADFIEMVRYHNANVRITVTTNAIDPFSNNLIHSAVDFGAKFNVSWHDVSSKEFYSNLTMLRKNNLLNKIIIVPSIENYKNLDEIANKLKLFGTVVFRPLVGGKNAQTMIKRLNESLQDMKKFTIESSKRIVDYNKVDNIKIVTHAASNPDYYRGFCCKCGKNAVLFYDGKLYNCLSQAINGNNPHSLKYTKELPQWVTCEYDFCSCDTFDLRRKE